MCFSSVVSLNTPIDWCSVARLRSLKVSSKVGGEATGTDDSGAADIAIIVLSVCSNEDVLAVLGSKTRFFGFWKFRRTKYEYGAFLWLVSQQVS